MPALFERFFAALETMSLGAASAWALLENIIIFGVVLLVGRLLVLRYQKQRVTEPPDPLTWQEMALAASCVLLNTLVTVVGIWLWQQGVIDVQRTTPALRVLADTLVLFFAMDLLMYIFHRVAHHPLLYPLIHHTHHLYENPRPLTLFALNPFEVLGFGGLWLLLLTVYSANWLAIIIYLTLNVVFGLVGHLGVEPMPLRYVKIPLVHYLSTSTFHAEHHQDADHNFGFYTLIWDRLFGTLSPDYMRDFTQAHNYEPERS